MGQLGPAPAIWLVQVCVNSCREIRPGKGIRISTNCHYKTCPSPGSSLSISSSIYSPFHLPPTPSYEAYAYIVHDHFSSQIPLVSFSGHKVCKKIKSMQCQTRGPPISLRFLTLANQRLSGSPQAEHGQYIALYDCLSTSHQHFEVYYAAFDLGVSAELSLLVAIQSCLSHRLSDIFKPWCVFC